MNDLMEGQEIAMNTVKILGGSGRLQVMIGANSFVYDKDGRLWFQFKMCKKTNRVCFEVTPLDFYKITFYKFRPQLMELDKVEEIDGLYFDQIREVFEKYTGLYLSL